MSCKFFSISTYDYLRNTCLHYIYELELVLCRPRLWLLYDEYHPTSSPIQCLRVFHLLFLLSYYCYCYCHNCYKIAVVTTTVTFATTIYRATKSLLQRDIPCVVELTTQLLWLINILWFPLCQINKSGCNTTREDYCDPLYLWVIKTIFWRHCRGA